MMSVSYTERINMDCESEPTLITRIYIYMCFVYLVAYYTKHEPISLHLVHNQLASKFNSTDTENSNTNK